MPLSHGEVLADAGKLVDDIVTDLPDTQTPDQSRVSMIDARRILLMAAEIIELMLNNKPDTTVH